MGVVYVPGAIQEKLEPMSISAGDVSKIQSFYNNLLQEVDLMMSTFD